MILALILAHTMESLLKLSRFEHIESRGEGPFLEAVTIRRILSCKTFV